MLHTFCTRVISMSIMGMLAILVTLCLKKAFSGKLSPKAHLYIWLPVILRLTIPHMVSSRLSVYNYVPSDIARVVEVDFTPVIYQATENSFRINYIFLVWLAGFIVSVAVPLISYFGFKKSLRYSSKVPQRFDKMCKKAATLRGIGTIPKTIVCENMVSPMIVGFIKPCLIIPKCVIESFDDEQINIILVHEYTHFKRKDRFVNLFVMLCTAVHWFNPLVWTMAKCLRRDMENVCDEEAMAVLGEKSRATYGKTILDLVECAKFRFVNAITSPMACSSHALKNRIRTLCLYGTKRLKLIILPICIIISTTLLTGAVADKVDIAANVISDSIETITNTLQPTTSQNQVNMIEPSEYVTDAETAEVLYDTPHRQMATQDMSTNEEPTEAYTNEPAAEIPSIEIPHIEEPDTPTKPEPDNGNSTQENSVNKAPDNAPDKTESQAPDKTGEEDKNKNEKVYSYTADGATAQFSSEKQNSGFAYNDGELQIETVGLISSDSEQLHGYFNVYQNGELVADTVRAYVNADPNNLSFNAVENEELDYSFKVKTKTIE